MIATLLSALLLFAPGQNSRVVHIYTTAKSSQQPYSAATNHSNDLTGDNDTRDGAWGTAGYSEHYYVFHPPDGYAVRIMRIYGNFQGWERRPTPNACAGALWAIRSTASNAPIGGPADYSSAATFLYIQDATCGTPFKDMVDFDTSVGGLLGPDNTMISTVAVFLNDTGVPLHLEPSFVIVYRFEPIAP